MRAGLILNDFVQKAIQAPGGTPVAGRDARATQNWFPKWVQESVGNPA